MSKRDQNSLCVSYEDSEEAAICNPREEVAPDTKPADSLILDF